jgi:hypothetical protein
MNLTFVARMERSEIRDYPPALRNWRYYLRDYLRPNREATHLIEYIDAARKTAKLRATTPARA